MIGIFRKFIFYFSLVLVVFLFPISVFALSSGGIGGYPANPDPAIQYSESWFIYNLDLGESKDDALLLFNTGEETKTVKLYPVDSIPSNQGNFALEAQDAPRDGIGAWIKLAETLVTLEPGESREIPFVITIPKDADVGEHSGGIIIQKAAPGQAEGEAAASVVTRVGIRVYQTVPGEIIKEIEIDDFSLELIKPQDQKPYYDIVLTAKNKGNVSLSPKVSLEISGWGKIDYFPHSNFNPKEGIVIDFKDLTDFFTGQTQTKDWQLLRDQKVTTRWSFVKPQFGKFSFQAKLNYESSDGPKTVVSKKITVWVVPWLEVLVIALVLSLIISLVILKKLLGSGRKWQSYKVQKGDQLVSLAESANVSWKKVAKVNRLKTPLLKEGQVIKLPPGFKPLVKKSSGKKMPGVS